jgi:hypothetical protein
MALSACSTYVFSPAPGRPRAEREESFFCVALVLQKCRLMFAPPESRILCVVCVCSHNWCHAAALSYYLAVPLITRRLLAFIHHVEGRPIFNALFSQSPLCRVHLLSRFIFSASTGGLIIISAPLTDTQPGLSLKRGSRRRPPPNTEINAPRVSALKCGTGDEILSVCPHGPGNDMRGPK